MPKSITLSIEPIDGDAYEYGFHLGTDVILAKHIAAEKFHGMNSSGDAIRTVALFQGAIMINCYDGVSWSGDYLVDSD